MSVHKGDLYVQAGVVYDYTEVTGDLVVRGGIDAREALPRLVTVGGVVHVSGSASVSLPVCTTVGGGVRVSGSASVSLPVCTTVGGLVHAFGSASVSLPVCATVGGSVGAYGAGVVSLPVCTTVGGGVYASGSASVSLPVCTTVGGGVYASGSASVSLPNLEHKDDLSALSAALARVGLALHDGILSRVVRRRGAVTVVQRVGSTPTSYVVTDGTHTAHGDTLAEARADLRLKQSDRDTSAFAHWTADTLVTLEDGIAAYRAVTGACGAGVRQFLAGRKLPKKLPVSRILTETQGQYGAAEFAAFVRGGR